MRPWGGESSWSTRRSASRFPTVLVSCTDAKASEKCRNNGLALAALSSHNPATKLGAVASGERAGRREQVGRLDWRTGVRPCKGEGTDTHESGQDGEHVRTFGRVQWIYYFVQGGYGPVRQA